MASDGFERQALAARTRIAREHGRWVVTLEVLMIPDRDDYVIAHRIADYPTEAAATVAARWIERAAQRDLPRPPLGF
jgi:hypothetical protein